jgi:hypothetical protein
LCQENILPEPIVAALAIKVLNKAVKIAAAAIIL